MTREEWIKRCVTAGAPSEDYADSLYMAYTDDGESNLTPEEIAQEDAAVRYGKRMPNETVSSPR